MDSSRCDFMFTCVCLMYVDEETVCEVKTKPNPSSSSVCSPGGLKVTCEYMAQQEGVLCEEVLLLSETNEDVCVKVKVHARVMGEATLPIRVIVISAAHCSSLTSFCCVFGQQGK